MSVAIPKNTLDDHYFMFPGYTVARASRPAARQRIPAVADAAGRCATSARFPAPAPPLPDIEALIEEHELLDAHPAASAAGDDETAGDRRARRGDRAGARTYAEIPRHDREGARPTGLSLEGAGEALSIGAAGLFLRSLDRQPDGCAPAHQRQPAALSAAARRA